MRRGRRCLGLEKEGRECRVKRGREKENKLTGGEG